MKRLILIALLSGAFTGCTSVSGPGDKVDTTLRPPVQFNPPVVRTSTCRSGAIMMCDTFQR